MQMVACSQPHDAERVPSLLGELWLRVLRLQQRACQPLVAQFGRGKIRAFRHRRCTTRDRMAPASGGGCTPVVEYGKLARREPCPHGAAVVLRVAHAAVDGARQEAVPEATELTIAQP
eukprot:5520515-Prymnesium_polylepis.1